MAKQFASMTPAHRDFIARQRIFFTASATASSRVNVSPRPTDALRVLNERTVAYLDLTGSGSETAAHLHVDGRITLMFCALDEPPSILRLYGRGVSLPRNSSGYSRLLASAFENEGTSWRAADCPYRYRSGANLVWLWRAVISIRWRAGDVAPLGGAEGRCRT